MPTVRRKVPNLAGHQLIGSAAECIAVCEWVSRQGYPWLIGDATHPETLAPKGGKAGDPGIYLDPASGDLVIHTGRESMHASYGDWVIKQDDGAIHVVKEGYFNLLWEVV